MRGLTIPIVKGQTLIGLLVSLALATIFLLTLSQFYTHIQIQNRDIVLRLSLQAEMQRILQLIAKDLRRAGFRAVNEKLIQSNLSLFELDSKGTAITISQANNAPQNSCVLFFYDLNANGCIGEKYTANNCMVGGRNEAKSIEKELFGYKLNGKMVETRQTYKSAVDSRCDSVECKRYLAQQTCNAGGGWTDLFDEKEFEVSQLIFTPLANNRGIEVRLSANLVQRKDIRYDSSIVIPLLNQEP